ncbi:MAG: TldD/PmbA family protein [Armatimonadota bacterium]
MVTHYQDIAGVVNAELRRMTDAGCAFADARYFDESSSEYLMLYDGNLEGNGAEWERGIGVRVLYRGAWGFAATANLDAIPACFDRALANGRAAAMLPGFPREMGPARPVTGSFCPPVERDPADVPLSEKLALMQDIDRTLQAPHVAHRFVFLRTQRYHVFYWNSEGTEVDRLQVNPYGHMRVMATDAEGRAQRRTHELSGNGQGTRGFEWLANGDEFVNHAERLKRELAELLAAEALTPGRRSVILLPGQGWLQVHETIGHALELDRILGYERSFMGASHVKPEMIGSLRYGSEKLTCRAGVTPNSPGTFGYDDEGSPQREIVLIDRGLLVNVLSSRGDIAEVNDAAGTTVVTEPGNAARACAFYRPPIDRMPNVNIDPGEDGTLEDIIAATEDGIILDYANSWSIGPNREHFHFGCELAWEVKDGARTRVLKSPSYQGHTLEMWHALDLVGDASTWRVAQVPNCGKGEPNQVIEVGHGVPVMRFGNVETGERS